MKKVFIFLILFSILNLFPQIFFAKTIEKIPVSDDEFEKTKQLIVMVNTELNGVQEFGAGVIVGSKPDELLIATAYHLLHNGLVQASKTQVQFRFKPDQYFEAGILKYSSEETMDLALISVKGLSKQGIDICKLPFDRLNDAALKSGDGVFALGNPNGASWSMPIVADKVADILGNNISFQSSFISKGNSGGALLDTAAAITGLVVADQPPFGRALSIEGIIKKISDWGYPVNLRVKDYKGQTPLHVAADKGDIATLKTLLLSACNDVNIRDDHKATPLHFAAYSSAEAVKLLIKAGADINTLDADGDPPLEWADEAENIETIKLLVDAGATWSRWSPLTYAAVKGDLNAVKTLAKNKNEINKKDDHEATPLHFAAAYATPEVVQLLLNSGADTNALDEDNYKPIDWAAKSGMIDNIKLLLKLYKPEQQKYINEDLVHVAVSSGQIEVLKFLMASGTKLNDVNEYASDEFLLTTAVKKRQYKMIQFLIQSGEDPSEGDGTTWDSPLLVAVKTKQIEAIKILRNAGANINVSDMDNNYLLDFLFERKWKPEVKLQVLDALLYVPNGKSKAIIDSDWSVGVLFVNKLDEDFVMKALKLLIAAGANVNEDYSLYISYDNYEWRTPLSLALDYKYDAAARLLRDNGAKK